LNELKRSWDVTVRERYEVLKSIYELYKKYRSFRDVKKISITPFESACMHACRWFQKGYSPHYQAKQNERELRPLGAELLFQMLLRVWV